ncbi:MAG: Leu/Ile/Val-binding protein [Anaerolineae bacterium]|nr:Leu/Ile/Val-binding protein [Anaerolineae bacterium]
MNWSKRINLLLVLLFFGLLVGCSQAAAGEPIKVGLIAPLSGPLATSGEAIQRGMLLAMDEVNAGGGVLGRPLELVTRDVQNDPAAGVAALKELVEQEEIVAVFGGIFSPVMVAQLDTIHQLHLPLINPWGSMTTITQNGRTPNYAFRVSVSDEQADEFLARYTVDVIGARYPAIIADTSDWGEANLAGLTHWLAQLGVEPVSVARFDQGDTDMTAKLKVLQDAGADSLLMVANTTEGAAIARGRAILGWGVPIISHWGISGGRFSELAGVENTGDIFTLQTYSFFGDLSPRAEEFLQAYHRRFGTRNPEDVQAPVGVVHGYDGVQLLAQAIRQAGTTAGPDVQAALEHLQVYNGLVKEYNLPFNAQQHDALLAADYMMTVWQDGRLVPAPQPHLSPARP